MSIQIFSISGEKDNLAFIVVIYYDSHLLLH